MCMIEYGGPREIRGTWLKMADLEKVQGTFVVVDSHCTLEVTPEYKTCALICATSMVHDFQLMLIMTVSLNFIIDRMFSLVTI